MTLGDDGLGHLTGGRVDHLVAEHGRAARLDCGGAGVGLDDRRSRYGRPIGGSVALA
jgi:hypothetical protein